MNIFLRPDGSEQDVSKLDTSKVYWLSHGIAVTSDCRESTAGGHVMFGIRCGAFFIDEKTGVPLEQPFTKAGVFSEGLVWVTRDAWPGFRYMNAQGKFVTDPIFQRAGAFSEGLAAVSAGGSYGYIDKEGEVAIRAAFDEASRFSEGLAAVLIGDSWGYINNAGKIVIPPRFRRAEMFREGLARVIDAGGWTYIDRTGKVVFAEKDLVLRWPPDQTR